jgi:hypothetical protein
MPLRESNDSRAIRVALVEPNDADVRWFSLIVEELKWPVEMTRYTTGLSALKQWSGGTTHVSFDLIVVTDLLPLLTLDEFIAGARVSQPEAKIIAATEPTSLRWLQSQSYACYPKPLSVTDVRQVMGLRPKVFEIRGHVRYPDHCIGPILEFA